MSETINLNQIIWKRTVKTHFIWAACFAVIAALFNLMALYDYSKLPAKVDKDVKEMLPGFLYMIPGTIIGWGILVFLLFKFNNRSFYRIFSIILVIVGSLNAIFFIIYLAEPDVLGPFAADPKKKKKYYPLGKIGQDVTQIENILLALTIAYLLFKLSSETPKPTPKPVVVVKKRSKSVQKEVTDDDDSSE